MLESPNQLTSIMFDCCHQHERRGHAFDKSPMHAILLSTELGFLTPLRSLTRTMYVQDIHFMYPTIDEGCSDYNSIGQGNITRGKVVVVESRYPGNCSDLNKTLIAQAAGAIALIIVSKDPIVDCYATEVGVPNHCSDYMRMKSCTLCTVINIQLHSLSAHAIRRSAIVRGSDSGDTRVLRSCHCKLRIL